MIPTSQYPLSAIAVKLECTDDHLPLLVIASATSFGVLIPMRTLPRIRRKRGKDKHDVLFDAVTNAFEEIVAEHVAISEEHDTTAFPLPAVESIGPEFSGEFLKLTGSIEAQRNSSSTKEDLVLDGEYFFIAEAGVTIYEFLVGLRKNSDGNTLH